MMKIGAMHSQRCSIFDHVFHESRHFVFYLHEDSQLKSCGLYSGQRDHWSELSCLYPATSLPESDWLES